jgi:putative transposase
VRTCSRALPAGFEVGSPALVRKGRRWWLHTPIEKSFTSPPAEQLTTAETRICAVDLNLDEHLAVCTVQTVEGTILATRFIGRGRARAGFRKRQLGRIVRFATEQKLLGFNRCGVSPRYILLFFRGPWMKTKSTDDEQTEH